MFLLKICSRDGHISRSFSLHTDNYLFNWKQIKFEEISLLYNFSLIEVNSLITIKKYFHKKPLQISFLWVNIVTNHINMFVIIQLNESYLITDRRWYLMIPLRHTQYQCMVQSRNLHRTYSVSNLRNNKSFKNTNKLTSCCNYLFNAGKSRPCDFCLDQCKFLKYVKNFYMNNAQDTVWTP